jgi:hypothetical protein
MTNESAATPLELRTPAPADHAAWLPLWRAYQAFYKVAIPEATSAVTWGRLLDPAEPMHAMLAWQGARAVGLVHWIYHRACWSVGDYCYLNDLFAEPDVRGKHEENRTEELLIHEETERAREDGATKHGDHEALGTRAQLANEDGARGGDCGNQREGREEEQVQVVVPEHMRRSDPHPGEHEAECTGEHVEERGHDCRRNTRATTRGGAHR